MRWNGTLIAGLVGTAVVCSALPAEAEVLTGAVSDKRADPLVGGLESDITAATVTYDRTAGKLSTHVTLAGSPSGTDNVVAAAVGIRDTVGGCASPYGVVGARMDNTLTRVALEETPGGRLLTAPARHTFTNQTQVLVSGRAPFLVGLRFNCFTVAVQPIDSNVNSDEAGGPLTPGRLTARLGVAVKGLPRSLRRNRTYRARVAVRNTGTSEAVGVRLGIGRARGMSARPRKRSLGSIGPGRRATATVRLRFSRRARSTTKVALVARAGSAKGSRTLTVRLR